MIAGNADERERVARFARAGHVDGALLVSTHAGDPIFDELQAAGSRSWPAAGRSTARTGSRSWPPTTARARGRWSATCASPGARGSAPSPGRSTRRAGATGSPATATCSATRRSRRASCRRASTRTGRARRRWSGCSARAADIDAVFVASDLVAAGALATLRRAGRTVPDDIAVAGFDDSQIAIATTPPLTTIRHPLDQVAETMVDMVVKHIAGEPVASQLVPTELVRRESA